MGPSKEALALADFLIARDGLTADRYQLAYAIMEHEEKAMRAEPEQVGEVQGDGRSIIEEFVQCAALGRPHGKLIAQAKDYLAARQPGGK